MSADIIELGPLGAAAMHSIEEVWQLRAQVLEHVKAIEELRERMLKLPHVWGVCPLEIGDSLDMIESALTPAPDDPDLDPMPGDGDYRTWRRWAAFKKAKSITI